jgi:hypothetical protein
LVPLQVSELRTPDETKAQIYDQLHLATLSGGTEKVKNHVAATGIRDSTTSTIIECLLEMGKRLRKRHPGKETMTESQIQALLADQMEEQLQKYGINPLIGMPGMLRVLFYQKPVPSL